MLPQDDLYPPVLHSDEWYPPVPLPAPVNTAGAEDSPFITPDGQTLYFFFTPDPVVPPGQQMLDGVTGIYVSQRQGDGWSQPQRVWLNPPGELSLDGCQFVQGEEMWFCSVRKGNYREIDIWTARYKDGAWGDFQNAGEQLNVDYSLGELHLSADGSLLYYHSDRPGGLGGYDLWLTRRLDEGWRQPVNLAALNTPETEGWPFLSQDGHELWFLRWYQGSPAIYRSIGEGENWSEPELILSQFAGEPSLDRDGNLYFVHHYYQDDEMLEADIYVAYKK